MTFSAELYEDMDFFLKKKHPEDILPRGVAGGVERRS